MIHLHLPVCEVFGAGTCGKYLLREFSKLGQVTYSSPGEFMGDEETLTLAQKNLRPLYSSIDYPLLQFAGPDLEPQTPFKGKPTVGYVFFEWEPPTDKQKENLKQYDVLVSGSTWNTEVIRRCGFKCDSVPQGVDREIFKPGPRTAYQDHFVIYSGGKREPRKAQDLVIKAVRVLQQRHKNILLVASWFNLFSEAYAYEDTEDLSIVKLPLYGHADLAFWMNQSDVGLFPNRCEGGTNLMLMDYLACGKPVVANNGSGQKDVLSDAYSLCASGDDEKMVEHMVESVEYLYQNPNYRKVMGGNADKAMNSFSWGNTANLIQHAIDSKA